ncbi:hypothetical protein EW093_01310 [Thiospirochaeta perfilievii]|uniref:Endonuclease GajA/Old nuclease/RecF-like AAA domain-containing protein n=1 Tax=Thiospirochaeta perfilievii TaxID=252967 RepID=A0A5C1Q9C9_9SPIO|nr:AAA family ATPase [Thiospirochaeta perfilievii]QEN03396.1 hypothetical protein EW093_01310 [Thiospirochaeta perfilievii]
MNSLDKITIKGFKSIRNLENFKLKNLNVFIGGNGAGKSNIINLFKLLRNIVNDDLGDYVRNNGGASDLLFNGLKVTNSIFIETYFGDYGYKFYFRPTLKKFTRNN